MRAPISWLKDFVDIPEAPQALAEKLQKIGVPVEKIEYSGPGIKNVFAGKILEMEQHPNADKLRIAQVDLGKEKVQIITGAPNVKKGDTIPVAKIGAVLAGGKRIQEAKLRGLPSYGMMCSADELALGIKEFLPPEQQSGVMILDSDFIPGMDLSEPLGLNQAVLVLEPFANRPDYLSIFGIAREIATLYGISMKIPELFSEKQKSLDNKISISVQDYQACSRYTARFISGIKIHPSPISMAVRLFSAGIRPINLIVDITNYVLLELGQPLHAFDYSFIQGKKIEVKKASKGEIFKGIDEKEYVLQESDLVISDSGKSIALAGIIGGKESEVQDSTKEILLESAHFDSGTIRRTSVRLGIRTDSSRRFEKGLDPAAADWGSRRACWLFQKYGFQVYEGGEDTYKVFPKPREIAIRFSRVRKTLGIDHLERSHAIRILSGLGFQVLKKEPLFIQTPPLRLDIHEEIDVAEEIARHYGYDQIPSSLPEGKTTPGVMDFDEFFEDKLRDFLTRLGLMESLGYSLGDPEYYKKFMEKNLILIQNPLTEDRKALRPYLYPGVILAIRKNLNMKNKNLSFFELGKVFQKNASIQEYRHLCLALTGDVSWGKPSSFLLLKGMLEQLWNWLHIPETFELKNLEEKIFHPYRSAEILIHQKQVGFIGELHPQILDSLDISQLIFILELSLDKLQKLEQDPPVFKPLPLYPESRRDISMILDEKVLSGEILKLIKENGEGLIEDAKIFDLYQGSQVPHGKKSIAFSIIYRSAERTLTDEEVNRVHEQIREKLKIHFAAKIRE
jgi:phenylalanyl-tRNA synthetase beta chain